MPRFKPCDKVYGTTNEMFTGAYVEYVPGFGPKWRHTNLTSSLTLRPLPIHIGAVTAWQMLFDYAQATAGQTVLVHGAAGKRSASGLA